MKFLLVAIHAKYIHMGPAVYSLRSYAGGKLQEHVEIAEYTINQQMEDILADIYLRRPDAVGLSCYIWNISMVKKLIREFHKLRPEVPIWLGGPEVSYEYQKIFEELPGVTGIMTGEGEETFRELLQWYVEMDKKAAEQESCGRWEHCGEPEKAAVERSCRVRTQKITEKERAGGKSAGWKESLRALQPMIAGTVTRDGFFGIRNPLDMDTLPFYYEQLEEAEKEQAEHKIIYYESSRGCPFRCSYCLSSIEKQVRLRSLYLVKRELQYFLDRKVKQVKFIDRTFNCDRNHAMEIWRYLTEHDNGVTNFHFETAAELLTAEEFKLFSRMRPGLIQLEIGVQTTNRETLRAIHRPADLEKLKMTVASVHGLHNIHQHLDLIAGLPYEDIESFRKSFNDVYEMRPDQLQLGFLKVLKGSEMYDRAQEFGIVSQSEPPYEVLYTKWLSYEDLQELKKVEKMLELFYNSGQFERTLKVLEKLFESPYTMFLSLAAFYEERGFFVNSPARSSRYEIILEFLKYLLKMREQDESVQGKAEALFKELLTFDFYLREKAKSRPAFAGDIRAYYQEIWAFYREQEREPDLLREYVAKGFDSRQMMRMTHVDIFQYPVWDGEWLAQADLRDIHAGEGQFVLFDYDKRDPLNHGAGYAVIKQ